MRKILFAGALALGLGACSSLGSAVNFATVGVANPITKQMLYNFENGLTVAFAGLKAYKSSCAMGAVDVNCKANVASMQFYTRQIPPELIVVRGYVKNNDQVNATTAYNTVVDLFNSFKSIAVANNVKVQ